MRNRWTFVSNQKLILNLKSQYKVIIKNLLLIRNWPQINRRYTPHFGCVPFDAHSALGIISSSLCMSNVKQEQIMLTIKILYLRVEHGNKYDDKAVLYCRVYRKWRLWHAFSTSKPNLAVNYNKLLSVRLYTTKIVFWYSRHDDKNCYLFVSFHKKNVSCCKISCNISLCLSSSLPYQKTIENNSDSD